VNAAPDRLSLTFEVMYAEDVRPSIPPERLLRASLLQRCSRSARNGN
jgi:hypothetical protein